jgi:hypothetical protein
LQRCCYQPTHVNQQCNAQLAHITKVIFAVPSSSTLIQQTTFQTLNAKTVRDFNLSTIQTYPKHVAARNNGSTGSSLAATLSWRLAAAIVPNTGSQR